MTEPASKNPALPAPLVLVVDDELDLVELLREALTADGYRVLVARDGRQALDLLDVLAPNAIITDLVMPVMDGLEFLRRYANRPGAHAPVIAVSANQPYLVAARALGATATLSKPYPLDELLELLRDVLVRPGASRSEPAAPASSEERRLRAVIELGLDKRSPDPSLDRFARFVAEVFETPLCLVSIITETQQLWQGACGLPEDLESRRTDERQHSFCTHAVAAHTALVVQDTLENPYFKDNPLVQARGLRFYAGVPLMSRHGEALGTLCVLDYRPRTFTHFDLELLSLLSKRVVGELGWREKRARPSEPESAFRHLGQVDPDLGILGRELFWDVVAVEACRQAARRLPASAVAIEVPREGLAAAVAKLEGAAVHGFIGRLGDRRLGWLVAGRGASEARALARKALGALVSHSAAVEVTRLPSATPELLRQLEASLDADAELADEAA